jgi:hypothetical protein
MIKVHASHPHFHDWTHPGSYCKAAEVKIAKSTFKKFCQLMFNSIYQGPPHSPLPGRMLRASLLILQSSSIRPLSINSFFDSSCIQPAFIYCSSIHPPFILYHPLFILHPSSIHPLPILYSSSNHRLFIVYSSMSLFTALSLLNVTAYSLHIHCLFNA